MEIFEPIRERYVALFENEMAAIFFENYEGQIIDCNKTATLLLGFTKEEILTNGKQLFIKHCFFKKEKIHCGNSSGFALAQTKSNRLLTFAFTCTSYKKYGNKCHKLVVMQLIAQQKSNSECKEQGLQAEQQAVTDTVAIISKNLQLLFLENEEKNKKLTEIAWKQSHLVRAPIVRMLGLLDLLQNSSTIAEKEEVVNFLKASVEELDQVTREIISISEKVNKQVDVL